MALAVARSVFEWDLSAELPGADALIEQLKTREAVQKVEAGAKAGQQEFKDH